MGYGKKAVKILSISPTSDSTEEADSDSEWDNVSLDSGDGVSEDEEVSGLESESTGESDAAVEDEGDRDSDGNNDDAKGSTSLVLQKKKRTVPILSDSSEGEEEGEGDDNSAEESDEDTSEENVESCQQSETETDDSDDLDTDEESNDSGPLPSQSLLSRCWKCPVCAVVLTNRHSKYQHLKTHGTSTPAKSKGRGRAPYACPARNCTQAFQTYKAFKLHYKMKHPASSATSPSISCQECGATFENKTLLKLHAKSHATSDLPLECLMCLKKFATPVALGDHYVLRHQKKGGLRGNLYQCPLCPKNYVGQGSLKEHILVHHLHKKLHQCSICQKEFARKDNLQKHLTSVHKDPKTPEDPEDLQSPFIPSKKCSHAKPSMSLAKRTPKMCDTCGLYCLECGYTFPTQKKFSGHSHTNLCTKCGTKFRNGKLFKLHEKYHSKKPSIVGRCELCLFGFESDQKLQNHRRLWHNVKSLSCPVCGKEFKSKNNLNVHKQIHKERKFTCDQCSKPFLTSAHLKRHQVLHLKNPNFVSKPVKSKVESKEPGPPAKKARVESTCPECSKICPSEAKLKVHMKIHSHICDVCEKSFSRPRDLRLHQLTHGDNENENTKPHKCDKCSKSYLKPQGLTQHLMSSHGFQPNYFCEACSIPFSSEAAMNAHFAKKMCDKRKISRRNEVLRRVEANRRKRREDYGLDDDE